MGDVTSWSKTPASNSNADPSINWAEGQPKNTINDSARAMMAAIAQFRDDENGIITTGGTSNNFTVALSQSITAYNKGLSFLVAADRSNPSASPTMTVGGLATIEWRKAGGVSWAAGEIIAGSLHRIIYNGAAGKFESVAFWPHAHAPADLQAQAPGTILANITAGPGSSPPAAVSLSLALDALIGAAHGMLMFRGDAAWEALAAGTDGQYLKTIGPAGDPVWSDVLPALAGNAGKLLTTDGSALAWSPSLVGAKATFTGVASPVVTGGLNVASVTRVSAGTYDVTFTTALASTAYQIMLSGKCTTYPGALMFNTDNKTTTGFRIRSYVSTIGFVDGDYYDVVVVGP